jgi:hypothetical protein
MLSWEGSAGVGRLPATSKLRLTIAVYSYVSLKRTAPRVWKESRFKLTPYSIDSGGNPEFGLQRKSPDTF